MPNKILTEKQELFIDHLPDEIHANFYLAEGTALAAFYLCHRISEDLDFFTEAHDGQKNRTQGSAADGRKL